MTFPEYTFQITFEPIFVEIFVIGLFVAGGALIGFAIGSLLNSKRKEIKR